MSQAALEDILSLPKTISHLFLGIYIYMYNTRYISLQI